MNLTIAIGDTVIYTLSEENASYINLRRTSGPEIARRARKNTDTHTAWPIGVQPHLGSEVSCNDEFPMIITRVIGPNVVSGQVFLDGTDVFWAQEVEQGRGPLCWHRRAIP